MGTETEETRYFKEAFKNEIHRVKIMGGAYSSEYKKELESLKSAMAPVKVDAYDMAMCFQTLRMAYVALYTNE